MSERATDRLDYAHGGADEIVPRAPKRKKNVSLNDILEAASRQVSSWPAWMQRPEYRQRPPAGNSPVVHAPKAKRIAGR